MRAVKRLELHQFFVDLEQGPGISQSRMGLGVLNTEEFTQLLQAELLDIPILMKLGVSHRDSIEFGIKHLIRDASLLESLFDK